ncbi:MAG: NAD-dependent epimerase/dehydratase family protein [Nannocystaceae bacterium]|nr:NAD-dependent epimerase/dehydratase family protein [Nannocystaceae bacterium]
MRVLVTGAAGSLGRNVVEAALARGLQVRALVRDPSRAASLPGVEWIAGDARDAAALTEAARGCEALLHLVNVKISDTWVSTTAALLDAAIAACRATGARLVFPANVWIYGRGRGTPIDESVPPSPCSRMGQARADKERRIAESGARFVMLRLPEFYGPHVQTLTGPPLQRIAQGKTATWFGPPDVTVDFTFMPDAARALLEVGLGADDGEVFHMPGVAATSPRAFFALARELAGGGGFRAMPPWVVRVAGVVHPTARAFADILHLWTDPIAMDGSKLRARFPALTQTSYRDGLAQTLAWLRRNPDARMYA